MIYQPHAKLQTASAIIIIQQDNQLELVALFSDPHTREGLFPC